MLIRAVQFFWFRFRFLKIEINIALSSSFVVYYVVCILDRIKMKIIFKIRIFLIYKLDVLFDFIKLNISI